MYKALSDETRLRILLLLCERSELCVCDLALALDTSQPKVSRHLAYLRRLGLLHDRKQAQWVHYRLHDQLPKWVQKTLTSCIKHNPELLTEALHRLKNSHVGFASC